MSYKDKNSESPMQVIMDENLLASTADSVFKWGIERNITSAGGATSLTQIEKLKEEAGEIEEALQGDDEEAIQLEIGDAMVVLLQICRLSGFALDDCLYKAWKKIEHRKGEMRGGVFVKEEDLGV